MPPAQQHFGAGYPSSAIDLRLEHDGELRAFDGEPQIAFEQQPFLRVLLHLGLEETRDVAAGGLAAVHRGVGFLEHVLHTLAGLGKQRDADSRRDMKLVVIELKGLA